jgi:hypothetical protein
MNRFKAASRPVRTSVGPGSLLRSACTLAANAAPVSAATARGTTQAKMPKPAIKRPRNIGSCPLTTTASSELPTQASHARIQRCPRRGGRCRQAGLMRLAVWPLPTIDRCVLHARTTPELADSGREPRITVTFTCPARSRTAGDADSMRQSGIATQTDCTGESKAHVHEARRIQPKTKPQHQALANSFGGGLCTDCPVWHTAGLAPSG